MTVKDFSVKESVSETVPNFLVTLSPHFCAVPSPQMETGRAHAHQAGGRTI